MKKVSIPIVFIGTITADVPDHLSNNDAKLLASKLGLARVYASVASEEDGDTDEVENVAFDEYVNECSTNAKLTSDDDWHGAMLDIGGTWQTMLTSVIKVPAKSALQAERDQS